MDINRAIYTLSLFSDMENGSDTFHKRRVTLIAYRIAEYLKISKFGLNLILQAGLMHDIGLISGSSKIETFRQIIDENFKQLSRHAVISSRIARYFNLHLDVSNAIGLHHTPADTNHAVLGNILFLADNVEVSFRSLTNPFAFDELYDFVAQKERLFNKDMLNAFKVLSQKESFWYEMHEENLDRELIKIVNKHRMPVNSDFVKRLAYFTAYYSDHMSLFYENYSVFVKNIAVSIGYKLSLSAEDLMLSSLFAHVGNAFLPTDLIDSPKQLNETEFNIIKSHPYYTDVFLDMLEIGDKIKCPAVCHHENLSGSGYPFKVSKFDKNTEVVRLSTVLAALLQDRPFRAAYNLDEAKDILKEFDFDNDVLDAALNLDLGKIIEVKDEYYEGIGRLFI